MCGGVPVFSSVSTFISASPSKKSVLIKLFCSRSINIVLKGFITVRPGTASSSNS